MWLDIKALAMGVIEEYGTNDPFLIAQDININILFHELPESLDAYRLDDVIVLNINLSYEKQRWVLAHELGHYFIHGPENTLSNFITNRLQLRSKCEKQADLFASELLLSDLNKYIIEGLNISQLAALAKVPEEFIIYKFSS
ncbi:ImmA/IrrE family metallo-endopeptidase [Candidatus Clostridium stratigraminis]|uniref:ImmA/IrrE family metallo-endopeptidase n=1 Tax=Candidatus Clostridium stratigraminis TaxID=3381661 RepID=A0ABW8T0P6_9CLOT